MLNHDIKRSDFIRAISLFLAAVATLLGGCIYFYNQAKSYKLAIQNGYKHSLQDFNDHVSNIYNYLDKGLYSGSAYQLSNISAHLLSDSFAATTCLSTLPASELHLDNTFKFLSQVGDYASSLNKKYHSDNKISQKDYEYLENLRNYAQKLNTYISNLEYNVIKNNIDLDSDEMIKSVNLNNKKSSENNFNFNNLEKNFDNYPKIVYDGPFSDHITDKVPELTKNLKEISENQAKKIAALATGIDQKILQTRTEEKSKMPLFCFGTDNISIGITKKGGLICYIINSRQVKSQSINAGQAIEKAKQYLSNALKIQGVEQAYYEINDNCCTINFACVENDIIIYPDLIRISIALDNGEILSVDTRNYINNHKDRTIEKASKTKEDAQKTLSSYVSVIKEPRLALIPTDGQNEILTYEFICRGKNNEDVLIYINCNSLEEEQILVLSETENGIVLS